MQKFMCLFVLTVVCSMTSFGQRNFNVISYNIRYNNAADGENAWPNRKENVKNLLKFHKGDIICLQEALHGQVLDLKEGLIGFDYVGVGREDGDLEGEFAPIFFNTNRFILVEDGHFWLSESPEEPSKGWDAACTRICTWVKLKDKKSQKTICIFNTHFDHQGDSARIESSKLLCRKIEDICMNKYQGILTGDFNATPDEPAMARLRSKFRDTRHATELPAYGPEGTFNGFDYYSKLEKRIDYIFVTEKWNVKRYGVLTDSKNNRYYSDHLPVIVEVVM